MPGPGKYNYGGNISQRSHYNSKFSDSNRHKKLSKLLRKGLENSN